MPAKKQVAPPSQKSKPSSSTGRKSASTTTKKNKASSSSTKETKQQELKRKRDADSDSEQEEEINNLNEFDGDELVSHKNDSKKVKFEEDDDDNEAIESLKQKEPPQNRQPGLEDEETKKELSAVISEILNRQIQKDKSQKISTELPLLVNSKAKTYQRFMEFMKEEKEVKSVEKQRRRLLLRNCQAPAISDWEKEKSLSNVATQGIIKLLTAVLQKKRESNNA
ncbi:predicted protein [Naegleria gruberi]|uniref:Predicted protein n=1 Tax=Naegleria gruberi TaxID=5762 RepID=D2VEN5_NAEGR|nr:uncharacterized protein NAEGRDRAFT_67337 [Naegleria gruberi]EFC44533.1 predicted protein [Naegleria gruberi]|eukprot:XP_002677277.1 predicted protein [Naegleria gruberi strain NEG-M]